MKDENEPIETLINNNKKEKIVEKMVLEWSNIYSTITTLINKSKV